MPHVREVTAPATIEFKSHEKEEFDPVTGKIVCTRIIYPIIIPKEKESTCISVPPLLEAKGQLNSLVPSPLAVKPVTVDGSTLTTTTPRGPPTPLPMPCADQVKPVPAEPTRDIADPNDVVPLPHRTPTPPRWMPLTAPFTPPISSPVRDFRSSCKETPIGLQLQADPPATTRPSSVSPQPSSEVLSPLRTSPCDSSLDEGIEGEEGQFDDAEEGELCDLQRLHPSEQPLPPSLSPSPTPSPVPSQVNQLVQRILETKCSVAMSPDIVAESSDAVPDAVDVVADHPEAPLCPEEQGSNDETPIDTSVQGEKPNALPAHSNNIQPPNAGRGALVKQLFTPRGAFAAPRMVCPPPVVRKSAKELTALEPLTLPPLLP